MFAGLDFKNQLRELLPFTYNGVAVDALSINANGLHKSFLLGEGGLGAHSTVDGTGGVEGGSGAHTECEEGDGGGELHGGMFGMNMVCWRYTDSVMRI